MRWDGGGDGADVGDDVDDDLNDARDDDDDDNGDDRSPRRNPPAGDGFFFSIGFHHEAAAKLRNSSLFRVSTPRG